MPLTMHSPNGELLVFQNLPLPCSLNVCGKRRDLIPCTITLGSVNTPLWDTESINSDFDRTSMLSSKEVSETILYMAQKPESQLIEDLTLMPSGGAF